MALTFSTHLEATSQLKFQRFPQEFAKSTQPTLVQVILGAACLSSVGGGVAGERLSWKQL